MTVRPAQAGDLAALAAIERACFSDAWSESAIRTHLASDATLTLVAEDESGAPCGALFLSCLPPEGEVYRLAVLPDCRMRGIGRLLLSHGLAQERDAGVTRMYLDVRVGNAAAIALYRALGFVECGRRANYYRAPREDAVLMERELFADEIFGDRKLV